MLFLNRYKFKSQAKGETLYITYTGKIRRKQMDEIMNKIYLLLHKHEYKKILIDSLKADVHLELKEIMEMAKVHPPVFKRAKTAVVEKAKKASQYGLYETVSGNHGVNMQFFNSMEEAEKWLNAS